MARVTGLLEGCNQRKIGRRRLLRVLGMTATAGFAVNAGPKAGFAGLQVVRAAAGGGKTFPVTTMNHLFYVSPVPYATVRDWYVDLLGMSCTWDDGKRCEVDFGSPVNGMYIVQGRPDGKANVGHFGFGTENFMAHKMEMKAEMERRGLANIRPDGEHGWFADDPAGYLLNPWVPVRDPAVFPGSSTPCIEAESATCKEAYQVGLKNLAALPKPSGRGFKAVAYSMIALRVPEPFRDKEKEFYTSALGMKVVADRSDELVLRFGQNRLNIRNGQGPDGKPVCDRFGFLTANYDHAKVKAELDRRGLNPEEVSKTAWRVTDPAGFAIEIAGKSST